MIFQHFIRCRLTAFFALFLVGACASAPQTHHLATEPVELRKLFVLGGIGTEDNNVYAVSFIHAITNDIQSCNIEVKADNVPIKDRSLSLDTDPFVAVNADIARFGPDGVLRITQGNAGGLVDQLKGISFVINVILINPARSPQQGGPMIWNGAFKTDSELSAAKGALLARDIFSKMKQDNVIKGCN